jgi:hypothetical protein
MDNRAATTVVAKLLTFGIVMLYLGGMTAVLFGGAVPEYRDGAGAELGERVLVTAADRVQGTIPPAGRVVTANRSVDLPSSIRGAAYRIVLDGDSLVLDHPAPSISGRQRLALPARVSATEGSWHSGADTVVSVRGDAAGVVVRLTEGEP